MKDYATEITAAAQAADSGRDEHNRKRAILRRLIIDADRYSDLGVNEIARLASVGMSRQKVIDAVAAGRLEREVLKALKALAGDPARVVVRRQNDQVLVFPIGDEADWGSVESQAKSKEDALEDAKAALSAYDVKPSGGGLRVRRKAKTPEHHTAWLTTDSTCLDQAYADVVVLADELRGEPDDPNAWSSTGDPLFRAATTVDAKEGDHGDAQREAEDLLTDAGWTLDGTWEPVPTGYIATVTRN